MSLLSADFFQNELFQKILAGTRVSKDLDPDQDLCSVQIVCKGYQQMTTVAAGTERAKSMLVMLVIIMYYIPPQFYPLNLQHSSCKLVF